MTTPSTPARLPTPSPAAVPDPLHFQTLTAYTYAGLLLDRTLWPPSRVLQQCHKAESLYPAVLRKDPALHVTKSAAYMALGDLSSAFSHLKSAQVYIGTPSPFIEVQIATLALALAICTLEPPDEDATRALRYLSDINLDLVPEARPAVMLHSARALLLVDAEVAAIPLLERLAEETKHVELHIICARLRVGNKGNPVLPAIHAHVTKARQLDPTHPGLKELLQLLDAAANRAKVEIRASMLHRQYARVLETAQAALQYAHEDPDFHFARYGIFVGLLYPRTLLHRVEPNKH
jgi:hypothetical protein